MVAEFHASRKMVEKYAQMAAQNRISSEDRTNLERLQKGFTSRHTAHGPLAPLDPAQIDELRATFNARW